MSARFYKIFAGVLAAHVLVLSLVWVGFSAPLPRPPATFIYQGTVASEDPSSEDHGSLAVDMPSDSMFDEQAEMDTDQWTRLRDPAKVFKP